MAITPGSSRSSTAANWVNYTPTSSVGFSGALTVVYANYLLIGNLCIVNFRITGTSNFTNTWLFSMPIANKAGTGAGGVAAVTVTNNGAVLTTPGFVLSNNSGSGGDTEFAVYRDLTGTLWTGSGTKGAWGTISYPV